jgi:Hemerythrin HHE cation binding domain
MKGMAMTTKQPGQGNNGHNDECPECDPARIDHLKCNAAGVAAQAAYNAQYQDALTAAQAKFREVRDSYRSTRHEVALEVQDMRHQTRRVIDRIKCLIKQERVVHCLDEAWEDVRELLIDCWKGGCCAKEDEWTFDIDDCETEAQLKHRIAKYLEHAAKAQQCFQTLTGEPAALAQRVSDRKADLDAILAQLAGDPAKTDLKRVYAMALVERHNLSTVWNGFNETKDFADRLCRALTCWTEGSVAIAILKGRLAVLECKEQAEKDRCAYIHGHPVDEVLMIYDKNCGGDPCPEREDEEEAERERERRCREGKDDETRRRRGENDVIDFLLGQHKQIKSLFEQTLSTSGKQRKTAFLELRQLLTVHETAEEKVVHPVAKRKLPDGDKIVAARLEEEREAKAVLAELEKLDVDTEAFTRQLCELRDAAIDHAEHEERDEFAKLQQDLSSDELERMGRAVKLAESIAPTRPQR